MNRMSTTCGVFAALSLTFLSVVNGTSLTNPGFESEALGDEWSINGSGYEIELDRSRYYSGQASLRISGGEGARGVMFQQTLSAEQLKQNPMVLRTAIKTEDIAVSATAFVTVKAHTGETLYSYDMRDRVVSGSSAFSYHQIPIPRLEAAESISIGGVVIGPGTAWFDDFSLQATATKEPMSELASDYLDEALELIRERAIGADQVNWVEAREDVFSAVEGAQHPYETYPGIRMAISMLPASGHMSLVGNTVASTSGELKGTSPMSEKGGDPKIKVASEIGYLRIPMFQGRADSPSALRFIANTLKEIRHTKSEARCGWVVDLRGNAGGNMWVLLAAVSPFLSDGIVGKTMDAQGNSAPWLVDGNSVATQRDNGEVVLRVDGPRASDDALKVHAPIVVLVDSTTASAAENVSIALQGEKGVILMGEATRGLTTANIPFALSDGAQLVLSVGFAATRNSEPVLGAISPSLVAEGDRLTEYSEQHLRDRCEA